jgi:lipopolysaccharide/colanic/teichoic acid biosynthesis glycosyltransferase
MFKFRSMRDGAEADGIPVWASTQDHRITRVGRFIRWARIDELPQLLNVLRGEMSVVGPRPERPYFVEQFNKLVPFYDDRHAVLPGITGWAQVNYPYGASIEDAREKLRYDLHYIANFSFLLDIKILVATVGVMLTGDGAR